MKSIRFLLLALAVGGCSGAALHNGGDGGNGSPDLGGLGSDAVVIQSSMFTVKAGSEVFMCQDFANPFGGVDAEVQEIDSDMTPGSHHMLLMYQNNATDSNAAVACNPLQFGELPYGAQTPHNSVVYPTGIATLVKGTQGFHMQMHYLNATTSDLVAQVTITFHKSKPGTVTQHAGVFFFNNFSGMNVAPGATQDVTATCTFQKDVNVLYAVAHTHHFTNSFTASIGGTQQYQTNSWDASPFKAYNPAIAVPAGTQVTWTCNVTNTTQTNLTFGESALTNDMCIFDGQYYPADDASPTIGCMR